MSLVCGYCKDNFFAQRKFDTDQETGLTMQLRAYKLIADSEKKEIEVFWRVVLLSPLDAVVDVKSEGSFRRYNATVPKYDLLKASAVGQGIAQMIEQMDFAMIENDMSNFPQILNQE